MRGTCSQEDKVRNIFSFAFLPAVSNYVWFFGAEQEVQFFPSSIASQLPAPKIFKYLIQIFKTN